MTKKNITHNIMNLQRNSRNLGAQRQLKGPLDLQGQRRCGHDLQNLLRKNLKFRCKLRSKAFLQDIIVAHKNLEIRYKLTIGDVFFLKTFLYNLQQFVSELKGCLNFAIASGRLKNSWERTTKTVLPSGISHKTIFC